MIKDNTLERARACFDRVSQYEHAEELCRRVRYYLGDRIVDQMTREEVSKLTACLGSLHQGAMKAGRDAAEYEHRKRAADKLDDAASALAKQKLSWVLDNFDSLTTED